MTDGNLRWHGAKRSFAIVAGFTGGWVAAWTLYLLGDVSTSGISPGAQTTLGVIGLVFAVALGACVRSSHAFIAGATGALALIFFPRPADPEELASQAAGACDPFCDTGGSLAALFGPFALLFVPFLILPIMAGALLRAGWRFMAPRLVNQDD